VWKVVYVRVQEVHVCTHVAAQVLKMLQQIMHSILVTWPPCVCPGQRCTVWDNCCWRNRQIIIVRKRSHCRWKIGLHYVFLILCAVPFHIHLTTIAVSCVICGFPPYHRYSKGYGYLLSSVSWPPIFNACSAYVPICQRLTLVSHLQPEISKLCVLDSLQCFAVVSVPHISHNIIEYVRIIYATAQAIFAQEKQFDISLSQHFHSRPALCGVKTVTVWRVAGDVTCSSGVASWNVLVLGSASQENAVTYVIILPKLTYLIQVSKTPDVTGKNGLNFWNQRQKPVQKRLLLLKHQNPCKAALLVSAVGLKVFVFWIFTCVSTSLDPRP
jgi:hypothetical protein